MRNKKKERIREKERNQEKKLINKIKLYLHDFSKQNN